MMRWTWILGLGSLALLPFACSSGFSTNGSGGSGDGGMATGSGGSTSSSSGTGGGDPGTPCSDVSACPSPSSQCETWACTTGHCKRSVLPSGAVPNPIVGNCYAEVCDGAGNQTRTPDDGDAFDDGNACTDDKCVNHVPSNASVVGKKCGDGKHVCDDVGDCVECITGTNSCAANTTCVAKHCVTAACKNGSQDIPNGETDVDCGGTNCAPCADGDACLLPRDCDSGVCSGVVGQKTCQMPTCSDSVTNGNETAPDCGGSACPPCGSGAHCTMASDCASGVCTPGLATCADPACNDGVKNGDETDVDCGGSCNPCHDGKHCAQDGDCLTDHCAGGEGNICDGCDDGKLDNGETDIDCGHACVVSGHLCAVGSKCNNGSDCNSGVCCSVGGSQGAKVCATQCG